MLPTVDILLPCYNPPKGWEVKVLETFKRLKDKTKDTCKLSLSIVNDGSKQNLTAQVEFLNNNIENFSYHHYNTNKGKGFALRTGVKNSSSDLIVYTDIDFPYTDDSMLAVIEKLVREPLDLILTKRDENYYNKTDFFRKYISKFLKLAIKLILRMQFLDTQAGLKGMNKTGKKIFLSTKTNRYLFDLEFVKLSSRAKINTSVVNIKLREGVVLSKMSLQILFSELFDFIRIVFR